MSKTYIAQSIRREVYTRNGEQCAMCSASASLDLHHVQPEYAGGATVVDNLIPLCSNKLGGNACHILVHVAYRAKEKQVKRTLSHIEYSAIVSKLTELMKA